MIDSAPIEKPSNPDFIAPVPPLSRDKTQSNSCGALRNADRHIEDIGYGLAETALDRSARPRGSALGLYSFALTVPALHDAYQSFRKDRMYLSLRDELALVRASLLLYVQLGNKLYAQAEDDPVMMSKLVSHMAGCKTFINTIEGLVSTISDIEEKYGAQIGMEQVVVVLSEVVNILEREVEDPEKLTSIADKISRISWPGAAEMDPYVVSRMREQVGRASCLDDLSTDTSRIPDPVKDPVVEKAAAMAQATVEAGGAEKIPQVERPKS